MTDDPIIRAMVEAVKRAEWAGVRVRMTDEYAAVIGQAALRAALEAAGAVELANGRPNRGEISGLWRLILTAYGDET